MTNLKRDVCAEYQTLFDEFLSGKLQVDEFQMKYLSRFKAEKEWLDNELFDLLEAVFGDVDSFSSDHQLLAANPTFYLDEIRLKERIKIAANRLHCWGQ